MESAHQRKHQIEAFEAEAELLTVDQLDLLAQIELQLRTIRHTMKHIERLRAARRELVLASPLPPPYIRHELPGREVIRVHLGSREQLIIV